MLVALAVLVATSCDRDSDSWEGEVTISVDLESGQEWTAQGVPVDGGQFCPNGIRYVQRGIDPVTGETVRVHVWFGIMEDAITTPNSTAITFVVEHSCADGSGSFVTRELWGPDVWSVESGTGAYRELTGGGQLSFATVDYTTIAPLQLYLAGALAG
jgi:hypothetical protein